MRTVWAAVMLSLCGQVVIQEALRPLLDFAGPEAAQQWQAVNDGVMGGVSDGRFRITPESTLEFFGTLSLENNGGFVSFGAPKPATHRRPKPATMWVVLGGRIVLFGPVGKGRDQVVAV